MLITNFASGELSETLFGRTDMPQYFAGAAKIVNFDVIPTGGLRRRSGSERVKKLDGEGRLIPFVVNRSLNFLLYLTPGRITAYKLENGKITGAPSVFESGAELGLYETLAEIEEAQYAQNFDTMIIVHENYPPIEIKLTDSNLVIKKLVMSFAKEVVSGMNVTEDDEMPYRADDGDYANGRLTKEGHYPAAVSFFNGRLVFAATKNERPRLFFSAVKKENEIYNFATDKVFLTEKKEYVVVRGKIKAGADTINMADMEIPLSFTKNLTGYFVENNAFFETGTHIIAIEGGVIRVSTAAKLRNGLTQEELDGIESFAVSFRAAKAAGSPENSAGARIHPFAHVGNTIALGQSLYMYCMADEALFGTLPTFASLLKPGLQPANQLSMKITGAMAANVIEMNNVQAREFLRSVFYPTLESYYNLGEYSHEGGNNPEDNFNAALDVLASQIKTYFQYTFRGEKIIGHPDEIYRKITGYNDGVDAYIPFFTREIISDEYPTPDCGFTFEIASDMNDAIRWLVMNKGLIVGTETGEWIIPPDAHAVNAHAALNSRYGSDRIQGAAVGDAACFFRAGKKSLVEYYIPQQDNNFRANNMATLSMQMLSESPAKEFDYISSPYAKLLITREDGSVVTLLYERSAGVFAWSRIVTRGDIKSAAVLPGADGNDDAYIVVRRLNDFYLERLRERCGVYLDSFSLWNGDSSGYSEGAVIYDEVKNEIYKIGDPVIWNSAQYIGYPYESSVQSMPILANDRMKQNVIKNLLVRFHDSFMPRLKSLPNGKTDTIPKKEPFTGVIKLPFPGVWEHDVMFEFIHDKPSRCTLLAINAEVN